MKQSWLKLILVTNKNHTDTEHYLNFITQCAMAGVTAVQLREKNMTDDQLFDFGLQLKKRLKPYSIPLIVNDHIDIACELNAEGLHLGQSDGDIIQARKKLGHEKLIGLSVNSKTQLLHANALPIDYLGIGPVFATPNKPDAPLWHYHGLQQAVTLTSIPGENDFITDGAEEAVVPFGTPLMPLVTGMGCTQAAVIAAFASIGSSSFESAVSAAQFFGICGNLAAMETDSPGSFRQIFIDKLYAPDFNKLEKYHVK